MVNTGVHTDLSLPVRVATMDDYEAIMAMARLLHEENGLFPLSEHKASQIIERACSQTLGIVGAIGPKEDLHGALCLLIEEPYYSESPQLLEVFMFVHPNHRRSNHAKNLIAFGKRTSEHMGIPWMIGVVSNERTAAKTRLYRQMLPPAGEYFLYVPESLRASQDAKAG